MKNTIALGLILATFITSAALGVSAPFDTWITKLTGDITFSDAGAASIGSSKVTSAMIVDETIVSADIDDGTIVTADIAAAGVAESNIDPQNNGATDVTDEGLFAQRVARAIYDVAVDGGAAAAYDLGVTLPAGAMITRSYIKIITQFVDGGAGTVALSCEDANNIKTATDITGSADNAFIEGASTGASSAFVRDIATACNITATVATAEQTAGKLLVWVHYDIED